jgi:succinate dehydrogenase/fumarate reductase-like Fe-S protein
MPPKNWLVQFLDICYKAGDAAPHFETFRLEVRPDETVLDAVERIWANQDRSLVFRHACHHAGCGACGMRINGHERLACITRIDSLTTV